MCIHTYIFDKFYIGQCYVNKFTTQERSYEVKLLNIQTKLFQKLIIADTNNHLIKMIIYEFDRLT